MLKVCLGCGAQFNAHSSKLKNCGPECNKVWRLRVSAETATSRFWKLVNKDGPDHALGKCWVWTGFGTNGYGMFCANGKRYSASRYSYELLRGPVDPSLWILHHCDNPSCVNPVHLYAGTVIENNADMVARDRYSSGDKHYSKTHPELRPRGVDVPHAKIADAEVLEMRRLYRDGANLPELANRFSVSSGTVFNAVRGKTWKHLPDAVIRPVRAHKKMTVEMVRELRELRRGGMQIQELSQRYGIFRSTVEKIISRLAWKHVA